MQINVLLKQARQLLIDKSPTAHLDVEVLLAHVLKKTRVYLHTWPTRELTKKQVEQFYALLERRLRSEPVAYLIGHREFWSLDFLVTPDTLIPRPETELLVELALKTFDKDDVEQKQKMKKMRVADLGTGCGAIALALAMERSMWEIIAVDQSSAALAVAKKNAKRLELSNVFFVCGQWCDALTVGDFDLIVSNPPYVANSDPCLEKSDVYYEPRLALVAGHDGLDAIKIIVQKASQFLRSKGWLMLEHGYEQGCAVRQLFRNNNFSSIKTYRDLSGHERVTSGCVM